MKFVNQIRSAIYDPDFYRQIPTSKVESGVIYFLKLILLLSLVQTIFLIFPVIQGVTQFSNKIAPKIVEKYPRDLKMTIANGEASTNVKEPYFVTLPPSDPSESKTNLVVIDTKTPYSVAQFRKYDTIILLKKDALYFADNGQGIRSYPVSEVGNFTLDRHAISHFMNRISPYFKFITPAVLILMFFLFFIGGLFRLIYFFFLATIVYLLAKIVGQNLSYKESYNVSLYVATLGLILSTLISLASPLITLPPIPFLVTIVSGIVFVLNFHSGNKSAKKSI